LGPKTRPAQRNDEADRLRRQVEKLKRDLEQAGERIAEQQEEIRKLEKELAEARRNSTNSSKPPSSDGLAGPQRVRGRKPGVKCKRRAGGQIGHAGHYRKPVEAAKVSQTIEVLPKQCSRCGHGFAAGTTSAQVIGEPHRHQVVDLPPIEAWITEYQCIKLECPCCGQATRAALPDEARDQMGPRLTALVAYLTVVCRMPRRVVQRLLEQAMGITISLGSTQKCWEQMSEAVEGPCDELESKLDSEPVLNVDETGWRQSGEKRWIWALVANSFTYYVVAASRSTEVLVSLLGAVFAGILCSDRFAVYTSYHQGKSQLCWAHLKRNLQEVLDQGKSWQQERFARDALALYASLFRLWWKFQEGKIDRSQLIERSKRIRSGFRGLAERWWDCEYRDVANLANAIGQHFDRLFCFIDEQGVEPTNNSVERALRIAVQWRKTSFGNRSDAGALATARLLTVSQTCALQKRDTLNYLTEALQLHRQRLSAPSLCSK
jgi:transposase